MKKIINRFLVALERVARAHELLALNAVVEQTSNPNTFQNSLCSLVKAQREDLVNEIAAEHEAEQDARDDDSQESFTDRLARDN